MTGATAPHAGRTGRRDLLNGGESGGDSPNRRGCRGTTRLMAVKPTPERARDTGITAFFVVWGGTAGTRASASAPQSNKSLASRGPPTSEAYSTTAENP